MADALLLMMFSWASKRGNICCGRKMFLKEITNICVSRTQILCPKQMLPARANRETIVSATLCPRLPPPQGPVHTNPDKSETHLFFSGLANRPH